MFVVIGARQKGKTHRLLRQLGRIVQPGETVRYVNRTGAKQDNFPELHSLARHNDFTYQLEHNTSASVTLFPTSHDQVPDYLVIDSVEKNEPAALQKLLVLLVGLEEELGVKILVAIQSGMDASHYQRVTGESLVSVSNHQFIWLN